MQVNNQVIIIGSGIASLASAIRLAVAGFSVSVYEKNPSPGGKIASFEKGGFHFDKGPSLFTQPNNIEELFEIAGEPIEQYFNYIPVDAGCRYFYENGKVINAYTVRDKFAEEMQLKTGESSAAVRKYLQRSEKLYHNIGSIFTDYPIQKLKTWLHPRIAKAFGSVRYPYLFKTLADYNKKQFKTPEAQQLFNRFATYNGSNPYKAPAMLSLIPHLEQNEGTYYPKGGMIQIVHALHQLAKKKGVRFYFNSPVERIIHSGARVVGAVVNNINIPANTVISNTDVYLTYKYLLNHELKAKKLLKQERSSSAVIFYWGVNKSFPELGLHNILFSKDYQQEFKLLFQHKKVTKDPTIYINITSKMDVDHAPAGKENWFVMVNVPANSGQDWLSLKKDIRANVISKINRMLNTDIEPLIETEDVMDPVMIEVETGSYMGSLYGTSSNSRMAAFSRPANFTSFAKGLYFCGGSVHPGGGIPLCLKSAKITAQLIADSVKKVRH